MYRRTEEVGSGRYAANVVVVRYPARDVVSRALNWSAASLNLDSEVARRFVRSVRYAWDLATGAAPPPHAPWQDVEDLFIGRFAFEIHSKPLPRVRPLGAESLMLRSREDLTELCAVIEAAVEVADRIEKAPDFQLDRLPPPERPNVSDWILWPVNASEYERASSPFDLAHGPHRHSNLTHARAIYPDPDGCDTCWSEASALLDYHAHMRRLLTRRRSTSIPGSSRYLDPP
jgi:hypothetical protein